MKAPPTIRERVSLHSQSRKSNNQVVRLNIRFGIRKFTDVHGDYPCKHGHSHSTLRYSDISPWISGIQPGTNIRTAAKVTFVSAGVSARIRDMEIQTRTLL